MTAALWVVSSAPQHAVLAWEVSEMLLWGTPCNLQNKAFLEKQPPSNTNLCQWLKREGRREEDEYL